MSSSLAAPFSPLGAKGTQCAPFRGVFPCVLPLSVTGGRRKSPVGRGTGSTARPATSAAPAIASTANFFVAAHQPAEGFDSIPSALESLAQGEFLVVLDDEDRENEGDLIIAADRITTEQMAFMINETSGLICIGMTRGEMDGRVDGWTDGGVNHAVLLSNRSTAHTFFFDG